MYKFFNSPPLKKLYFIYEIDDGKYIYIYSTYVMLVSMLVMLF